jgi:hypothetical protein
MIAAQQARAFLVMGLCGAACALAHDGVRFVGWLLGGRGSFAALMDLFLGVVLAAGMTNAGLYLRMSPMRLYLFAGVGMGVAFWYATGGRAARRTGIWIKRKFTAQQNRDKYLA